MTASTKNSSVERRDYNNNNYKLKSNQMKAYMIPLANQFLLIMNTRNKLIYIVR